MKDNLALSFYQATLMLLADKPKSRVNCLFFHSRAELDDDNLFEIASELYKAGIVKTVIINGGNGEREGGKVAGEAWPGRLVWNIKLSNLGVNKISYTKPVYNTRTENDAFLEVAKKYRFKSALILAQPHQLLRAMLGMIQSMKENKYWMRIYTTTPNNTSWDKKVYGSQGKKFTSRFDHIKEEFTRILKYQKLGFLADFEILFSYLEKRNSIN